MLDVVVVDDDFMVARTHRRAVEALSGFRIVGVAGTGRDAISMIVDARPDLVLLDVYLPDMTGVEVIRSVRRRVQGVDFLVLTAAREVDTVNAALHGGVVSYLLKPFRIEVLHQRLRSYSERVSLLQGASVIDQATVDRITGDAVRSAQLLPKGLSAETTRLVASVLSERDDDISASECATLLGMSRVVARKYLEHFVDTGAAHVQLRYGHTGRPQRRYAWKRGHR